MKKIINEKYPLERSLYGEKNLELIDCSFDGKEDGESALKECENIKLTNCFMNLRYPMWHDDHLSIEGCTLTDLCRAALWYSSNITIVSSKLLGIKALRECNNIEMRKDTVVSPEFGWRSHHIKLDDVSLESEYLFFEASNMDINNIKFKGKYSFQYTHDVVITNSVLDTKDAFWHSNNVTVNDSVVKGEYLAWYSNNLTLINCHITGTQPFCYCRNLKLINCTMEDCDLAFEYSEVNADIKGHIVSIKNPHKGKISVDSLGELIVTDDSKYSIDAVVNVGGVELK